MQTEEEKENIVKSERTAEDFSNKTGYPMTQESQRELKAPSVDVETQTAINTRSSIVDPNRFLRPEESLNFELSDIEPSITPVNKRDMRAGHGISSIPEGEEQDQSKAGEFDNLLDGFKRDSDLPRFKSNQ